MALNGTWVWALRSALAAVVLLAFAGSQAQTPPAPPVVFNANNQPQRVDQQVQHWVDTAGTSSAQQVHALAQAGGMLSGPPLKPMLPAPPTALWLRLDLERRVGDGDLLLSTRNTGLDSIALHWQDGAGTWQSVQSGDLVAMSAWPQSGRRPLFQLPGMGAAESGNRQILYLRIQNKLVPAQAHLYLSNGYGLLQEHRFTYFFLGGYFGLALVGFMWSVLRGVLRRQRVFRVYAALMASMLLTQLSVIGLLGQWLLPNEPKLTDLLSFVCVVWTAVLGVWFAVVFTQLGRITRRFGRWASYFAIFGLGLSVLQIVWHSAIMFLLSNVYVLLAMAVTTTVLLYAHARGVRYALWCCVGFLPVMVGALAPLARNAGLLGPGFFTQYGLVIGGAMECVLLFVVLLRRDYDLREARVRVQALASTDPVTGASDARVFYSRFHHALLRCAQFKHRIALVRIELHNHDWFVKEHGGDMAQRALVLTTAAIQHIARDVDAVGRVEENAFGLVMEGPIDAASAMKAATQILAKSLAPSEALPIGAQLKLFVAVSLLPESNAAAGGALAAAPDGAQSESAQTLWQNFSEQHRGMARSQANRVTMLAPVKPTG